MKGMSVTKKPILIVMAAGLGSRYGGLKQIARVDDEGCILIDYSLYDAKRAGFERVVFVITPELEKDFREIIGDRIAKHMDVQYAFQSLEMLPEGFEAPEGRIKPWGTAHAVLSTKRLIDSDFAVINADDYYGSFAYRAMYNFLMNEASDRRHAMIGYRLGNTLTEYGYVARGVCETDGDKLVSIAERTHIEMCPGGAAYTDDGENYVFVPADAVVSMNIWGFGLSVMSEIEKRFTTFLQTNLPQNPIKCEYYLPVTMNQLLMDGVAEIKVIPTDDKWYGMTYSDDLPAVRNALASMRKERVYPEKLWMDERQLNP